MVKDRDFFAERGADENATRILSSTEAIPLFPPNNFHNKSLIDEQGIYQGEIILKEGGSSERFVYLSLFRTQSLLTCLLLPQN